MRRLHIVQIVALVNVVIKDFKESNITLLLGVLFMHQFNDT